MQRRSGKIDRKRRAVAMQSEIDPERRTFEIDAGTFARTRPELIDDGVLDALRDELRVVQRGRRTDRVNRERAIDREMLRPVDMLHACVKRIGIRDIELVQRQQDAAREPRFETRAIGDAQIAGELHARELFLRVARTERAQLIAQQVFETLRAGGEVRSHGVAHVNRDP
jgi:hypothetical protein